MLTVESYLLNLISCNRLECLFTNHMILSGYLLNLANLISCYYPERVLLVNHVAGLRSLFSYMCGVVIFTGFQYLVAGKS